MKKTSNGKKKTIIGIIVGLIAIVAIVLLLLKGCAVNEYKITFETNGGNTISSVMVEENGKIVKPEDPTREGYKFVGWYYNDELFDFNTKVNKDIELEARWEKIGISVEGVTLDKSTLSMFVGDSATLIATITPSDADEKGLIWTSSDSSIVTVDENGNIKAIKEGTVTITVTTKDGSKTAKCTVTVGKKETTTTAKGNATTTKKATTTTTRTTTTRTTTTTTTTTVQDRYTIVITRLVTQDGSTYQYRLGGVTKNGSSFNDYTVVGISGKYYSKGINIDSGVSIPSTVSLLKDGKVIGNATVSWKTETVQ